MTDSNNSSEKKSRGRPKKTLDDRMGKAQVCLYDTQLKWLNSLVGKRAPTISEILRNIINDEMKREGAMPKASTMAA